MRQGWGGWLWILLAAAPLLPAQAQQQPAPGQAPPERIGPVWDGREHQPNPAEIEARSRARGVPEPQRQQRDAQDVDKLYRDLTGGDPQAPPRATSRDMDRR